MNNLYGYCRISTKKQSIERQERNIKNNYPKAVIVKEAYTGTSINRPQFDKLLNVVKEGDTIIFDSVSRMSREAKEGFKLYKELYNKGINLIFIKEPLINTEVYKSKLNAINIPNIEVATLKPLMEGLEQTLILLAEEQFYLAFDQAQKEVEDLRQRTKEGMETARLNGKQIGLPKGTKLTTKKSIEAKEQIKEYSKEFNGSLKDKDVIKLLGLARNTYYKYKKELKAEIEG